MTMCVDTFVSVCHGPTIMSKGNRHRPSACHEGIAALCSEGGMEEYEERLALIELLKEKWSNGHKVTLQTQSGKY